MKSLKNKPKLSVVILNYNALRYLHECFQSICKSNLTDFIEVILVDNNSQDNSLVEIQNFGYSHPKINFKYKQNGANLGFAAGNNRGLDISDQQSKYVLFLNPDTTVESNTFQGMINYFEKNNQIDAATCYVKLALTGKLQPECHRGFPTPWNAFSYFFLPFLPNGYIQDKDFSKLQLIDCCVGAFLMLKRTVGDVVGWWNEKYFFYGEDLDFCYKIKKNGYHLYFIPDYTITHYQGISSGVKQEKSKASRDTKVTVAKASTQAMRIFYQENLINDYPQIFRPLIFAGINLLEYYRIFKAKFL